VYLAETHFLQVVPESLLLSKAPEKPIPEENDGRFMALGAPVYYEASVRAWAWARAGPRGVPGTDKRAVQPVVRGVQS
jgi:hypothetical protein